MSAVRQSSLPSADTFDFVSAASFTRAMSEKTCVRVNPQWMVDPDSENQERHSVIQTVRRTAEFVLFKSDVIEFMWPCTLQTGGVPLRVYRFPLRGSRNQDAPHYTSDSFKMDVQEVTYFTHAFDEFLTAEQLEIMWNFRLFAKGMPLAFIDATMQKDIISLSGQLEIPTVVPNSGFWTKEHWIKFFETCVAVSRTQTQAVPQSSLPRQRSDNLLQACPSYQSTAAFSEPSGITANLVNNEMPSFIKNTSASFAISLPRSVTDTEKASIKKSDPYSYTKLDSPLRNLSLRKTNRHRRNHIGVILPRSQAPLRKRVWTADRSAVARNSGLKVDPGPIPSPFPAPYKFNRRPERGVAQSNEFRKPGEPTRPLNVYGKDRGQNRIPITRKVPAVANPVWVNPNLPRLEAPSPHARENNDVVPVKQFVIDTPYSNDNANGENSPLLTQQGQRSLSHDQRLYTVNYLNRLVHTRGDDIFAILRHRCPGVLRQSDSSDTINLTNVPDAVLRDLYHHVIINRTAQVKPLQESPILTELSDEEMDFLWNEHPRLEPVERYELSRIIEATVPNVQYRITNESVPLGRMLPIAVQHFILKYVKDRKEKSDLVAEAKKILEDESLQELRQMANAMTNAIANEQKDEAVQKMEATIWKERDEALKEARAAALTNRDLLFGAPSHRRKREKAMNLQPVFRSYGGYPKITAATKTPLRHVKKTASGGDSRAKNKGHAKPTPTKLKEGNVADTELDIDIDFNIPVDEESKSWEKLIDDTGMEIDY